MQSLPAHCFPCTVHPKELCLTEKFPQKGDALCLLYLCPHARPQWQIIPVFRHDSHLMMTTCRAFAGCNDAPDWSLRWQTRFLIGLGFWFFHRGTSISDCPFNVSITDTEISPLGLSISQSRSTLRSRRSTGYGNPFSDKGANHSLCPDRPGSWQSCKRSGTRTDTHGP
jgi:hypothetical protein